jgi:hypothetical protein
MNPVESTDLKPPYKQFFIDHDLYPEACILATIHKFEDFCAVEVSKCDENKSMICIYPNSDSSLSADQIIAEFLNYLLNLSCRSFFSRLQQASRHKD